MLVVWSDLVMGGDELTSLIDIVNTVCCSTESKAEYCDSDGVTECSEGDCVCDES